MTRSDRILFDEGLHLTTRLEVFLSSLGILPMDTWVLNGADRQTYVFNRMETMKYEQNKKRD